MNSRIVVLLAIGAATFAAGCGSSSKSSTTSTSSSAAGDLATFKAGFAADKVEFQKIGVDLAAVIRTATHTSDSALATELSALADRTAQVSTKLKALSPPARFKGELAAAVAAFEQVTVDLRAVSAAAAAHNAAKTRSTALRLFQDSARFKVVDLLISKQLGLPAR